MWGGDKVRIADEESWLHALSNIKSDSEDQSSQDDEKTEISLDILCRFIDRYPENDAILTTSEGGITSIDYYTNFPTTITTNLVVHVLAHKHNIQLDKFV